MVSKQKSIFDSEHDNKKTNLVKPNKKEETVPLDESVFAIKKNINSKLAIKDDSVSIEETIFYKGKICCDEENDDSYSSHEDEVPLEESVFAKPKKTLSSVNATNAKRKSIDLDALFKKYKDIYMNEYIYNKQRLNMIDSKSFNICCSNLESSLKTKVMNVESYDIMKKIIKSSCTCVEEAFYCYFNMNRCLIELANEINPNEDFSVIYHIVDRSYAEVISEFGGMTWQK